MFKAIWLRQQDTEAAPVFSLKDRLSVYKIISLCPRAIHAIHVQWFSLFLNQAIAGHY